ncbi:peroxiredoxin family protein [Pedobacter hartonius]|uniref:thioredoxin-dependent peroxiredoxin n=1 Tax=Pedobacter hartonius TaxID=425514 RepID=A0A1H3W316_9SPHI|nr:peroxiredoxin family protein [Pedobacter hartonius]SDZ81261.1 Peroxiredoxin [Pedobacter hartonius]
MRKKRNAKTTLKNSLFALTLFSFSALSYDAAAGVQTSSLTPVQQMSVMGDTVKMTAGVPLKAEDVSPLLAGEQIPVLQLRKSSGEIFDLNKSVSETPTILVFYRGGWCPYCSKQLSGLQEIEKDLIKMGYQVIAVSTDSPENLNKTMNKEKLSYTLLSDADLNAARRFGIAFKSPQNYDRFLPETSGGKNIDKLLPVPSVFILNKKGNILFEYINPDITQRLSAPLLKAAAGALREEI